MKAQNINRYKFYLTNQPANWGGFFVRCLLFSCLFNLIISNSFAEPKNQIEELRPYIKPNGLYLDAQMQLELSKEAIDALEKGIVLHFVARVEVKRERWYWFDATDAQEQKVIKLSYQPLLRKYRVAVGGVGQTLNSLAEALDVVGSISQWHILDHQNLNSSAQSMLYFFFDLDLLQLPRPFQYGIRNNQDWSLHLNKQVDLKAIFSGGESE